MMSPIDRFQVLEAGEHQDHARLALDLYLEVVANRGRTSTPAERMLPLYQAGYKPSFFKEQKVAEVGKDEKGVGVKAAVITYDFYVTTPAGLELLVGKSCQPSWFYNFMGDRTIDPEQFNYTWH